MIRKAYISGGGTGGSNHENHHQEQQNYNQALMPKS